MMTESTNERGHPLDQIATRAQPVHPAGDEDPPEIPAAIEDTDPPPSPIVKLSPMQLPEPALLIDDKLRIAWQNQAARTKLWHNIAPTNNGNVTPGLLDLLLDAHFQQKVENWRKWAQFFVQQAYHMLTQKQFLQHIPLQGESQQEMLKQMLKQMPPPGERYLYSGRLQQKLDTGQQLSYWVVATQFEQGRYFVFKSEADLDAAQTYRSSDIDQRFAALREHGHSSQTPLYVLAAHLNHTRLLQKEMLAEDYSRLLTRLYRQSVQCIEKHGGIFHKLTGSDFLVFFLPDGQQAVQAMQVLECAIVLKTKMTELSREWKIRKGWLHDLELNMGLHWSDEHIGIVTSALGDNLTAFGGAQRTAVTLSRMAREGQIWATKAVINKIAPPDQKKLRFGIFRKGHPHPVLISKCFTRLKDLTGIDPMVPGHFDDDLANLPATQIFDFHA